MVIQIHYHHHPLSPIITNHHPSSTLINHYQSFLSILNHSDWPRRTMSIHQHQPFTTAAPPAIQGIFRGPCPMHLAADVEVWGGGGGVSSDGLGSASCDICDPLVVGEPPRFRGTNHSQLKNPINDSRRLVKTPSSSSKLS